MYGEIPAQEVDTKSPLIEEGGIYVISRFRVSNAKSGYRPVDARYMIEFTLHTTVSPARNHMPDFPRYGVSSKHQRINLYYCASGSDGVLRGHEVYIGSGRMSLRLIRCCCSYY